ncbi:neuromodulin-like isoform X2 [Limulus polyphemus]|uniref:Neuromodulin-like isoform X2 n=1 Tax=Limulus polyphemus TaxID=6850 RepID=A0ABM1SN46_LIMPO|nr:neuromodulin-like isoform X2 [Limulus polyphemus]
MNMLKTILTVPNKREKSAKADHVSTPEEEKAATKIQSSFRGYKARKEVKRMKGNSPQKKNNEHQQSFDPNDPDLSKAATKIQASFRGHKVRKEIKSQNELKKVENTEERNDQSSP